MTDALYRTRQRIAVAGVLVLCVMVAMSLWGWSVTEPGVRVPVHWNAAREVDRYGSRWEAFGVAPTIWLLVAVLLVALPALEPRRRHLEQSQKPWLSATIGSGAVMLIVHGLVVSAAVGLAVDVALVLPVVLGAMLAGVGNYMGKTRSNFFIGIRTPWTLSSERSWRKTHRWGGRVFVVTGVLMMLSAALPSPGAGLLAGTAMLGVATVVLVAYSWVVWRGDPDRR